MRTITVEIPDELASEIEPIRAELPLFLSITRQLFVSAEEREAHTSPVYLAYKQFIDFLALLPSPEEIKKFVVAPEAQERVELLLDRHGEGELTNAEAAELRVYSQINQVMGIKKAEAALALANRQ